MTRNPRSYSPTEIRKMSTDALMNLHVVLFDAYPNTFDREMIIRSVGREQTVWYAAWVAELEAKRGMTMTEMRRERDRKAIKMINLAFSKPNGDRRYSDWDVTCMKRMKKAGYGWAAIAQVYSTNAAKVKKIITGKIYK